jgi:hypothetical protein
MKILSIILIGVLFAGCSMIKTNIMEPEVVEVGTLSKSDRNALWDAAKNKCFDLEYNITSEDRDAGNLICQVLIGTSTWTLSVKINETGYKVTHVSNSLTSLFNPYLTKTKEDMELTLSNAVNNTKGKASSATTANNLFLKAQKRLIQLGYDPGTPDGLYGPKTKKAITQYQKDIGLLQTGELNQATISSLNIE